jgi:hypothetical protein
VTVERLSELYMTTEEAPREGRGPTIPGWPLALTRRKGARSPEGHRRLAECRTPGASRTGCRLVTNELGCRHYHAATGHP